MKVLLGGKRNILWMALLIALAMLSMPPPAFALTAIDEIATMENIDDIGVTQHLIAPVDIGAGGALALSVPGLFRCTSEVQAADMQFIADPLERDFLSTLMRFDARGGPEVRQQYDYTRPHFAGLNTAARKTVHLRR